MPDQKLEENQENVEFHNAICHFSGEHHFMLKNDPLKSLSFLRSGMGFYHPKWKIYHFTVCTLFRNFLDSSLFIIYYFILKMFL